MARAYPLTDLVKLVRAYGVLAGTMDAERVIAGELSSRWITREVEQWVPMSTLPLSFFDTPRGRDMLATELFPDDDIDPELLDPRCLDIAKAGASVLINTNRLPKLEPTLHAPVLAANILLGVKLYGNHGQGMPAISHDLIVAAMLHETLGKAMRYSIISASEHEVVDDAYVFSWFGDKVARLLTELRDYLDVFDSYAARGQTIPQPPSPQIATAVAAIKASRLRLTARAAGDQVISFLDEESRQELRTRGVDVDGEFPERPWLEHDYNITAKAFVLKGVDHYALREPLRHTLLMAVRDALTDPAKRTRLSGRRGKAVHELHINLPVMEYYEASEYPNSIETVHVASLEMMRALEKGRRKTPSTMSAHAFRIAALSERVLGRALEPVIVSLALLHDVVEDGSLRVTGFGHTLRRIQFRFGGPVAAMVSELTDSTVSTAGQSKAQLTLESSHLLLPQAAYSQDRFTRMELRPTETEAPYTLAGIVIKLLDTVVSLDEGLRDPHQMVGHWRHSGARIYWAERVRGAIVSPLLERLCIELRDSQQDPKYAKRPHHVSSVRLRAGLALVDTVLTHLDLYATQNLAILAMEFSLSEAERDLLATLFFDKNVDDAYFAKHALDQLLTEPQLVKGMAAGALPCRRYCTLFDKAADEYAMQDTRTFLTYRKSALRRQEMRNDLGLASADKLASAALKREQLLRMFDTNVAKQPAPLDNVTALSLMMSQTAAEPTSARSPTTGGDTSNVLPISRGGGSGSISGS